MASASSCFGLKHSGIPAFAGMTGWLLDDALLIECAEGAIRPLLVQRAGRGPMSTEELLRGFPIPKGTILS